jgi:hypothetical protein
MENNIPITAILLFVLFVLLVIIIVKESARLLIAFFRGNKNNSENIEIQETQRISDKKVPFKKELKPRNWKYVMLRAILFTFLALIIIVVAFELKNEKQNIQTNTLSQVQEQSSLETSAAQNKVDNPVEQNMPSSLSTEQLSISRLVGIWEYTSPKTGDTYEVSTFQFFPDGSASLLGKRFHSWGELKEKELFTGTFNLNGRTLSVNLKDSSGDEQTIDFPVRLQDNLLYMTSGGEERALHKKTMAEIFN